MSKLRDELISVLDTHTTRQIALTLVRKALEGDMGAIRLIGDITGNLIARKIGAGKYDDQCKRDETIGYGPGDFRRPNPAIDAHDLDHPRQSEG